MALPENIKVRIRRHLRYSVAGLYKISPAGGTVASSMNGWRFFQAYGNLEYRMNNLAATEEQQITGAAVGGVGFVGQNPVAGDTFAVNISGGGLSVPVTLTVTAQAGDQQANIAAKVAFAAGQSQTLQQAGFYAVALYGSGPFSPGGNIPIPECSIVAPASFVLSASTSSQTCAPVISAQGQQLPPSASLDGINQVFGFVPIMDAMEAALYGSSQNMDTKRADVWWGRSSEMAMRGALYEQVVERFSEFIGIPINNLVEPNKFKKMGFVRYL